MHADGALQPRLRRAPRTARVRGPVRIPQDQARHAGQVELTARSFAGGTAARSSPPAARPSARRPRRCHGRCRSRSSTRRRRMRLRHSSPMLQLAATRHLRRPGIAHVRVVLPHHGLRLGPLEPQQRSAACRTCGCRAGSTIRVSRSTWSGSSSPPRRRGARSARRRSKCSRSLSASASRGCACRSHQHAARPSCSHDSIWLARAPRDHRPRDRSAMGSGSHSVRARRRAATGSISSR